MLQTHHSQQSSRCLQCSQLGPGKPSSVIALCALVQTSSYAAETERGKVKVAFFLDRMRRCSRFLPPLPLSVSKATARQCGTTVNAHEHGQRLDTLTGSERPRRLKHLFPRHAKCWQGFLGISVYTLMKGMRVFPTCSPPTPFPFSPPQDM